MNQIQDAVRRFISSKGLVSHTSKVNGFTQVVLIEKDDYSGLSRDVVKDVNQLLIESKLYDYIYVIMPLSSPVS